MKLRGYQSRAVSEIRAALARHRSVCLALQVGGGKTVIACEIIRRVLERGRRALFVVHRVELVEQARDRLAAFGIPAGIIKAGFREQRELPVQVACVPSLVRRKFPDADLVIFDETHHVVSPSWLAILKHYREAGSFTLGITATPLRLDGKPLGEAFDEIVEPVTTQELIDGGYLLAPTVYAPASCSRKGLKVRGGDYALPELAERMAKLTGSITDKWEQHCKGKRAIAYAVNIAHSRLIEDALRERGARITHIDRDTPKEERARANLMLRAGELDVVTQVSVWTEGIDLPELEALIVARPTKSLSLHRQIIGRVLRPAPGKTQALILDHAGNHHEHGLVTDPIEWSLEGQPQRAVDIEPIRTCLSCYAIVPPGAEQCPQCFADIGGQVAARPPGVDNPGELVKFKKASRREKEAVYAELVREASARGHKLVKARILYRHQFGVWPRFRKLEQELYECRGHEFLEKTYGYRTVQRCEVCYETREPGDVIRA